MTTRKYYLSAQESDLRIARKLQSELMTKLTNFWRTIGENGQFWPKVKRAF